MRIITTEGPKLNKHEASARNRIFFYFVLYSFFGAVMSACTSITPHQNFKESLQLHLGRSMDFTPEIKKLLVSKVLPSGNIEYSYSQRWHGRGACTEFYEVDASTQKIIRVDFKAQDPERECILPP
jgi:hypothetical protein